MKAARPPSARSLPRLAAAAFLIACGLPLGANTPAEPEVLRLGFSYAMFTGINENDARASIKTLATTIARERRIPADLEPRLYEGADAAETALRHGDVNALGLTTIEYWLIRRHLDFGPSLMAIRNDDPTERYLVLAHRSGAIATLADLQQHRLALATGPRMSLASFWLDLELARHQQPPAGELLERIAEFPKPSKAVLAVFFRQLDACVVTRAMFETMVELNPQVARELRIIAESPPLVPALFAISAYFPPDFHAKLVREFTGLHTSVAGEQVLTIFQTDRVAFRPESELQSAFSLLEDYARTFPTASAARFAAYRNPRAPAKLPP